MWKAVEKFHALEWAIVQCFVVLEIDPAMRAIYSLQSRAFPNTKQTFNEMDCHIEKTAERVEFERIFTYIAHKKWCAIICNKCFNFRFG